jgi:hypothetical protein
MYINMYLCTVWFGGSKLNILSFEIGSITIIEILIILYNIQFRIFV